ncbi:MAG TPA: lytic transglycosylase domain-containing protein [Thermodesulfobacteriota bacterium]|nr:lytic transglycosylase domain-containing protein [Thermodesulfobacteriota bacterium]HQO78039.1 lytic transglycosylase domain-containing protein [Thermodesulfobacteriota bacterium]
MNTDTTTDNACRLLWMMVCASLMVFFFLSPTEADVYRFVDEQGVIHFTNVPSDARYKLYLPSRKHPHSRGTPSQYDPIIQEMSKKYEVDHNLVRAVIKVESDFNPSVVSTKGAKGLMQLMPETAYDMDVDDVFNPRQNIEGGVKYLRRLLNIFENDLTLTLAAYNAGENTVRQYNLQIPPYKETQDYVRKVMRYFKDYKGSGSI